MFSREHFISQLPSWDMAAEQPVPHDLLLTYLRQYQQQALLTHTHHRIGRVSMPGYDFCLQHYQPLSGALATAVICHGYMDHMGLYGHLVRHLVDQHVEVYIFDLAGHGLSGGEPLAVDNFDVYAHQLDAVLQRLPESELPLVLIGQSTGAAVISAHEWLIGSEQMVDQRIFLAPLVRPALWRAIRRQFHMLKHFLNQVPRRYTANSHDAAFLRFLRKDDPMQHGEIPLSWIAAMQSWAEYIENAEPRLGAVTCIQGMSDGTVDWHHNLRVLMRAYPQLKVELIEGARHHLVNESPEYRDQAFAVIDQVLSGLLESPVEISE